jgi:hypothetical protein
MKKFLTLSKRPLPAPAIAYCLCLLPVVYCQLPIATYFSLSPFKQYGHSTQSMPSKFANHPATALFLHQKAGNQRETPNAKRGKLKAKGSKRKIIKQNTIGES